MSCRLNFIARQAQPQAKSDVSICDTLSAFVTSCTEGSYLALYRNTVRSVSGQAHRVVPATNRSIQMSQRSNTEVVPGKEPRPRLHCLCVPVWETVIEEINRDVDETAN